MPAFEVRVDPLTGDTVVLVGNRQGRPTQLATDCPFCVGGSEAPVPHSGQSRRLAASAYATRRADCEVAASVVGPLRQADLDDVALIGDPVIRRRARHVVTENKRVLEFVGALESGDLAGAGRLMAESHHSLRRDFEVSTPALDRLVDELSTHAGVYGARLTGAGFGGCAVALTAPGALSVGWRLEAVGGAALYS